MSLLKTFIRGIIPSYIIDLHRQKKTAEQERGARISFYKELLGEKKLVFDVGANVGNRVDAFLALNDKVIAVEPQPTCVQIITKRFGVNKGLTVLNRAVGSTRGKLTLHSSSDIDTLASVSDSFVHYAEKSDRFKGKKYEKTYDVEVTTLDNLISLYGTPDFIKIDVEGYELEVLKGLSKAPGAVSFEFTPDRQEGVTECLSILNALGLTQFNISYGESMKLARSKWLSFSEIKAVVDALAGDTYIFADIYAKK